MRKFIYSWLVLGVVGCGQPTPKPSPKVYSKIVVDKLHLPLIDHWKWEQRSDNYGKDWKHYYRPEQYWITYEIVEEADYPSKPGSILTYTTSELVDPEAYSKAKIVDLSKNSKDKSDKPTGSD